MFRTLEGATAIPVSVKFGEGLLELEEVGRDRSPLLLLGPMLFPFAPNPPLQTKIVNKGVSFPM